MKRPKHTQQVHEALHLFEARVSLPQRTPGEESARVSLPQRTPGEESARVKHQPGRGIRTGEPAQRTQADKRANNSASVDPQWLNQHKTSSAA